MKKLILYFALTVLPVLLKAQIIDSILPISRPPIEHRGFLFDRYYIAGKLVSHDVAETYIARFNTKAYADIRRANNLDISSQLMHGMGLGFLLCDALYEFRSNDFNLPRAKEVALVAIPVTLISFSFYLEMRSSKIRKRAVRVYNQSF
jgi:hypothetical protein